MHLQLRYAAFRVLVLLLRVFLPAPDFASVDSDSTSATAAGGPQHRGRTMPSQEPEHGGFNRAPAKTAAQRYAEATGRDAGRFRPSPAESADSPFLAGAELEQWKRTKPDAWKQWVETRPQRARGDGEDEPAAEE